ncbi:MAG: hypothetical protein IKU07_02240 [Oscillospiraceae bacterium]|nr:hypothetical protein [Oscillospiraceae bacterium]
MKQKIWFPIVMIILCVGLLTAYLFYSRSVTDSVAPVVSVASPEKVLQVSVNDPKTALLAGITAQDDRDGDVTASLVVESLGVISNEHTMTVTYAAFDKAGNVGKAKRTVQYTDYEGPRYSLSAPLVYTFGSHFDVLNQVQVTDPLEGDIRHKIKTMQLDSETLSAEGIHEVRFRVTNSLGDLEELVLPVEVQYSGRFNAQLTLKEYLVYMKTGEEFIPKSYLQELLRGGVSTKLTRVLPEGMELTLEGEVDTETPGVYAVSYTLTDTNGGKWTAYNKLIVVVEE